MTPAVWPSNARPLPLARAIVTAVLALHVVILPLLYVGLDRIIVRTHSELFVAVAHAYTQGLATEFNSHQMPFTPDELAAFIDKIQSSDLVAYSDIEWAGQSLRRSTDPLYAVPALIEHDEFGEGGDDTYHVVAQLHSGGKAGTLRLGFYEAPIAQNIAKARRLIALALAVYIFGIVGAALVLSRQLSRPLGRLQQSSGSIADGDLRQALVVESGVRELNELGKSLERMRVELVDANAQLQMKQRLETVGTLAGGLAHEFNNVLVPLTLFTESALNVLPPEHVARPWLTRAVAAARRAREVVAKLLLFSGQSVSSAMSPANIAPAVEEALRLFGSLRPSNIALDARIDPAVEPVLSNSGSIVQIVMNLCTNAYHAIPPSGGRIMIVLRNINHAGGKFVELVVEDNGVGMDEATVRRIFEPFFTTREVGKGTGLGLSVVRGLVQNMGATIEVVSNPGRGAQFRILFPSAAGEA